eukprot:286059-Amorphochlora_amoeboformis.AAC.1
MADVRENDIVIARGPLVDVAVHLVAEGNLDSVFIRLVVHTSTKPLSADGLSRERKALISALSQVVGIGRRDWSALDDDVKISGNHPSRRSDALAGTFTSCHAVDGPSRPMGI